MEKKLFLVFWVLVLTSLAYSQNQNQEITPLNLDSEAEKVKRCLFEINTGYTLLLGNTAGAQNFLVQSGIDRQEASNYYKSLISGFTVNSAFRFLAINNEFFHAYLGANYAYNNNRAMLEGIFDPGDGVNYYHGQYSENININFFALSALVGMYIDRAEKWSFFVDGALGVVTYRNESIFIDKKSIMTSKAPGFKMSTGVACALTPSVSLLLNISALFSLLTYIDLNDGYYTTRINFNGEYFENISRTEFTAGIAYRF